MTFQRHICWQADRVHRVMNPEAEQVADEVFLAVHSEHPLWMVDPADRQKRWQLDPHAFLNEFLSPNRVHVQAAVIGESGAGKSHLIHWMKLNIPERSDRFVLSIPRSGNTLRGVLERIIAVLPPEGQRRYREQLDQAGYHNQDHAQRKERLLSEIALAIRSDRPHQESVHPDIENWLIGNLPNLFHDPYLRDRHMQMQGGIVDELVAHVVEAPHEYRRVTDRRSFATGDLLLSGVDIQKMSSDAGQFLTRLLGMPEHVDLAVEIVNRNLDVAIARMLNFTGDQLLELMHDVRRYLRSEGKQLVLLIEDLARLQGIDSVLLQALIESAGPGPGGTCELRWAMAVTTGYYERLVNTVRTRMSYVVDMDVPFGENALVGPADIAAFASRYLNAARLPPETLMDWFVAGAQGQEPNVAPNHCQTCPHAAPCHAAFGAVADVGLYPFTERAILNMARYRGAALHQFNPRRLIKDVLAEVLDSHGPELAAGEFPSDLLRRKMVAAGQGLPAAAVDRLRRGDPEHYLRQRTALELWGSLDRLVELPRGLYEAFDLAAPKITGVPPEPPPGSGGGPPPPGPPAPSEIQAVQAWANGASLVEGVVNPLRELVYEAVVTYIDWDAVGLERSYVASPTGNKPFGRRLISFRNQQIQPSQGAVQLTIPLSESEDDLRRAALALEGLLRFREHRSWAFPNGQQHLVALAECLESWSADVVRQLRCLPDGLGDWDPVATSVELLSVGAAVAGRPVGSDHPLPEAVNSLFEEWPAEAPGLSREWHELYRRIHRDRDTLLAIVRAWASGTKGGQTGGYLDAERVVRPLVALQQRWVLNADPPGDVQSRVQDYGTAARLYRSVQASLLVAVTAEHHRVTTWLAKTRKQMPPGTTKQVLLKKTRQAHDAALEIGISLAGDVHLRYNEASLRFADVDLDGAIAMASAIGATADTADLPKLAADGLPNAIMVSAEFYDAATRLLDDIGRKVDRELGKHERMLKELQRLVQNIRASLQSLIEMLTDFSGGGHAG